MAQLSHPARGAYRDRHGRWAWDAVAAAASGARKRADEWRNCGRQSRVVLTPRRWRQVRGNFPANDGGKKARSPGRARNKPLKPLRAGMPGDPGGPVATTLVCYLHHCTRGCGCSGHPAFPTPSVFLGEGSMHDSGASRREIAESYFKLERPHARNEAMKQSIVVIPGWSAGPDPESRDSGFDALHRPGMTISKVLASCLL